MVDRGSAQVPKGSAAHLALSLFMFTACRVSDAITLGRHNERRQGDLIWLAWQPGKAGSMPVEIPMLPPLIEAIRATGVIGKTYNLNAYGRSWASPDAFRNRFKDWCREAGLPDRSPHGIRKAAGHLLAQHGATQYQIMAVHGHAQATTSEVYTRSVERVKIAEAAMGLLAGMEW